MTKGYYTSLPDRSIVAVTGSDAVAFLQGLVTQDVAALKDGQLSYGALLTPQGKIAFDFFITVEGDSVFLECEKNKAQALCERLKTFILRRNITINIIEKHVVAIWNSEIALKAFQNRRDPRHPALGYRIYVDETPDLSVEYGLEEKEPEFYYKLCTENGVPNGSRDIAFGQDGIADVNFDRFGGVSWTKGCYMGQEVTARMHHRGLGKKGLYAVRVRGEALPPFTDIIVDEHLIGEMRSSAGGVGLAILRHDSLPLAAKAGLVTKEWEDSLVNKA